MLVIIYTLCGEGKRIEVFLQTGTSVEMRSTPKWKPQRKEPSTMADQQILDLIRQQLFDKWNLFRQEHPEDSVQT